MQRPIKIKAGLCQNWESASALGRRLGLWQWKRSLRQKTGREVDSVNQFTVPERKPVVKAESGGRSKTINSTQEGINCVREQRGASVMPRFGQDKRSMQRD